MVFPREVRPYDKNSKKHPKEQIDKIKKSIKEFGFNVPIILTKEYEIIAGHGRLLAAKELNLEEIPAIFKEDLSEEQIKAYRIADNKTAESEWDYDFLKEEFLDLTEENYDLDLTGFDPKEIEEIMGKSLDPSDLQDVEPEDANEIETDIKEGDIYQLGDHRLMCGDSLDFSKVRALIDNGYCHVVITDPPYNTGMSQKKNSGSTRLNHMFNDNYSDEEWDKFLSKALANIHQSLNSDSVAYIFHDWRRNHELVPKIKEYFKYSNLIIWDKVVHGLGSDYQYTHEFINVCKKGKPKLETHQNQEYKDIWHIQRKVGKNKDHATAKPLELLDVMLRHSTGKGDSVLDLFGGSGSTLIACEQLNRKCYMMEIDPKYCQVIINRWQKLTGKNAVKL